MIIRNKYKKYDNHIRQEGYATESVCFVCLFVCELQASDSESCGRLQMKFSSVEYGYRCVG